MIVDMLSLDTLYRLAAPRFSLIAALHQGLDEDGPIVGGIRVDGLYGDVMFTINDKVDRDASNWTNMPNVRRVMKLNDFSVTTDMPSGKTR